MDRTDTQITYDLLLDPTFALPEEFSVTVTTAYRSERGNEVLRDQHVAFITTYTIRSIGSVARFDVPAEAVRLLR